MMPGAEALDAADETCREYERVVDAKYLDQIPDRSGAIFYQAALSPVWSYPVRNNKLQEGKNTIKPRTLRKGTKAIHRLENKNMKN